MTFYSCFTNVVLYFAVVLANLRHLRQKSKAIKNDEKYPPFLLRSCRHMTTRCVMWAVGAFLCKPFLEGRNMNAMRYFPLSAVKNIERVIQQEHVYGAS